MSQSETVPYAVAVNSGKKGLLERITLRLIIIVTVCTLALGFIAWQIAVFTLSGGIKHTAAGEVVDLKSLGFFQLDSNNGTINDVPARFRALDGKKVILEGFMVGSNGVYDSRDFQFVYNIQNCCFNGPPLPQERVFVHVPDGATAPFFSNCSRVSGILHVKVERDNGVIVSVYKMDLTKAEPL